MGVLALTQSPTVTEVAETNLVVRPAPLHTALAPLRKGMLALAVIVMVGLPAWSGLGESAAIVGPGPSGLTYTTAEILEFAVDVALTRTPFAGSFEGAV